MWIAKVRTFLGFANIFLTFFRILYKVTFRRMTLLNPLSGSQIQEHHTQEHKGEVQGFGFDVLFFKEESADEEAHQNAAAADHRNDRDQGVRLPEGLKIGIVGRAKEEADEGNAPAPAERRACIAPGCPDKGQDQAHEHELI